MQKYSEVKLMQTQTKLFNCLFFIKFFTFVFFTHGIDDFLDPSENPVPQFLEGDKKNTRELSNYNKRKEKNQSRILSLVRC